MRSLWWLRLLVVVAIIGCTPENDTADGPSPSTTLPATTAVPTSEIGTSIGDIWLELDSPDTARRDGDELVIVAGTTLTITGICPEPSHRFTQAGEGTLVVWLDPPRTVEVITDDTEIRDLSIYIPASTPPARYGLTLGCVQETDVQLEREEIQVRIEQDSDLVEAVPRGFPPSFCKWADRPEDC